jgi:hypothetical protein
VSYKEEYTPYPNKYKYKKITPLLHEYKLKRKHINKTIITPSIYKSKLIAPKKSTHIIHESTLIAQIKY